MGVVRREWCVDSKGSRSESFYFIDKQRYFLTKTTKKNERNNFFTSDFFKVEEEKKCRMSCSFFLKFSFRYLPNETPTAEVQPRVRSRNDGIYSAVATAVHQKMVEANSHASTGSGF